MSDDHDPPPEPPRRRGLATALYRALGVVAVGLAVAGAFLPLLPTTVFLLIALWAFARGSPELADRLRAHPRFGPMIVDWEERGAIPRKAKATAVVLMAASWTLVAVTAEGVVAPAVVGAILVGAASYVLTRPSA